MATIKQAMPKLLSNIPLEEGVEPIPLEPPDNALDKEQAPHIEGIGQPVTACFFTRASANPSGW